jgi:hypothetical protein
MALAGAGCQAPAETEATWRQGPVPAGSNATPVFSLYGLPGDCRVFPVGEGSPDVETQTLRAMKIRNNLWDANTRRIQLVAARRETADFQIVMQRGGADVTDIDIHVSDLKGGTATLPATLVRFFLAGYVEGQGRFYPDILVPFEAGGVSPFSIPHRVERLASVPGQENQSVWVDVTIPAEALPGLYRGTVSIQARVQGQPVSQTLALEVEVLDLTLPAERSVKVVLDTYGGIIKFLKLDKDPEVMLDLERRFYRLAREHRMFINAIRFPQSGQPRKGYMPEFTRDAQGVLRADWTVFDRRYGPYLDGSAFDDGLPIEQFCLYFNIFWPAELWPKTDHLDPANRSPEKARYEALWQEYAAEYVRHFKAKGWDRVLYTVKMNHYQKPGQDFPLLWNTDMPRTAEDFRAVAYYANLTHRAFSEAAPLKVRFRMDPAHSFCREAGCPFPAWDECRAADVMKDVDLWFFEWEHGLSHLDRLRDMKARGKAVYVYRHGWTFRESAPVFRGLGSILWAAGVDGYNGWNMPHDDLKVPREDPPDNYTMYVGWDGQRLAAFPSIRLKMQRDSLADYEYLKLAAARDPGRTAEVVARLVRFAKLPDDGKGRTFRGPQLAPDPEDYERARRDLAEVAAGRR